MRFLYATLGVFAFLLLLGFIFSKATLEGAAMSDEAVLLMLAVVFAGGLAGGK